VATTTKSFGCIVDTNRRSEENSAWRFFNISLTGFDHLERGLPCQDANDVRCFGADGFVAVVSDGAGSAKQPQRGSRLICDSITTQIVDWFEKRPGVSLVTLREPSVRDLLEKAIDSARLQLIYESRESGETLDDFHATLVGVMADTTGGVLFHIGDGAAMAICAADLGTFRFSPAENGDYANETYFFTQNEWRSHLRITLFDHRFDLLLLMSDGVTPVALSRGGQSPFLPFVEPVSRFLSSAEREPGQAALAELLERESMRGISSDDKSLIWAKRVGRD
jgi:serine/threonine protein phosphatase PrpC